MLKYFKIDVESRRFLISCLAYPSSSREELICCASFNRSPDAPVLLIRSLPAKSQLKEKKISVKIFFSKKVFILIWQFSIIFPKFRIFEGLNILNLPKEYDEKRVSINLRFGYLKDLKLEKVFNIGYSQFMENLIFL